MHIFKATDGKWHDRSPQHAAQFPPVVVTLKIGGEPGEYDADPPLEEMCEICFPMVELRERKAIHERSLRQRIVYAEEARLLEPLTKIFVGKDAKIGVEEVSALRTALALQVAAVIGTPAKDIGVWSLAYVEGDEFVHLTVPGWAATLYAAKCKERTEQRVVTCVYCGHQYPDGTPTHQAELLTAHIKVCEKHPLREAEQRLAETATADDSDLLNALETLLKNDGTVRSSLTYNPGDPRGAWCVEINGGTMFCTGSDLRKTLEVVRSTSIADLTRAISGVKGGA